jgi:hypothetical protein
LAFPAVHRGVTSVIIGPRTLEQLESALEAATIVLDVAVLDPIDEIVPPGTNVDTPESGFPPRSDASHRRRPLEERAVAVADRLLE